jgi:large subunit ribosomal protein L5
VAKKSKGKGDAAQKDQELVKAPADYTPRMQALYIEKAVPALKEKFGFSNPMRVPRLDKVILNVGIGDANNDQKLLDSVVEELTIIAGQKPVVTRARKSISNFKLREGMQVGVRVTLRRAHMWEFLDKLFSLAMPRVRDFRGVSDRSFDGRGNYSMGIKEQIVFPEINYDRVEKIHGMDITIVTSAPNDEEARELLRLLGCPFRKRDGEQQQAA